MATRASHPQTIRAPARRRGACLAVLAVLAAAATAAAAAPLCEGDAPDPPFDAAVAWDEVQAELALNYAYWDRVDAPAVFAAAAPAMRAAADRGRFAAQLQTLLLLFRDSHLHVSPVPSPEPAWVPSAADLWFAWRGAELVVRDVKGGSAAAREGVRPGWTLLSIDGTDPRATVQARFTALGVPADAAQQLYAVNALAAGTLGQPRRFTFRVAGAEREIRLPPGYDSTRPAGVLQSTLLRDRAGHPIAVLRVGNSLGDEHLVAEWDRAVAALPPTAHVVIDLRDTPSGGNSTVARALMSHFVDRLRPYQQHELTAERLQTGVARRWLELVEPRPPFVRARPVVLAGLWTGSMGEGLAIGLEAAAGAPVVGSEMGQLLGAMVQSRLPLSCLTLSYANEKLRHVDGRPREDYRPPHALPAADTAADGSDPALRRARALFDAADAARANHGARGTPARGR